MSEEETEKERKRRINRKAVAKYRATHRAELAAADAKRRIARLEEYQRKDREAKARWYAANPQEARRRARDYGNGHPEARKARAAA